MTLSDLFSGMGRRAALTGALALVAATAITASAQAQTKVRVTLDWVPQSTHGPTFIAQYEGYFKAEGLDVTIAPGKGSADAVRKLVAGTHDIGWPDINALIEFNSKNPGKAIKTSYKLFPAFAAAIGIDANAVKKKNMNPRLREPMLIRGDVDSISGHVFSTLLAVKAAGLKESDVDCFLYGNHGMESYANGIAVSPAFAKKHPEAVKGFIRATYKAARDMVLRPKMALAAVKKFQPLVQNAVEADRLRIALDCCILTPNVKKNGYGSVDMGRLQRSINQAASAYGLKTIPKAEDMFDPSFLPPKAQRFIHK